MSFLKEGNIFYKENRLEQALKTYRIDINNSPFSWTYINMSDLLITFHYKEQAIASLIMAYKINKKEFILRKLKRYSIDIEKYINFFNKKIETKYDLNNLIVESLWGGYSFLSTVWLEYICIDSNVDKSLRIEAAWHLGRWYHYSKQYDKALDKIDFLNLLLDDLIIYEKQLVLFLFYVYKDTNNEEKAETLLRKGLLVNKNDEDYLLALSSILNNEVEKLDLINQVFVNYGLSKIEKKDNLKRLSLDNICSKTKNYKNSKTLVTIIMPTYNAEKTISFAIDSIINQSWKNFELLIVDDCSSDATYSIAKEYEQLDSRIKVFKQEINLGAYSARNLALLNANGDFITTHDSDDWSHPEKISMQVEYLINNKNLKGVCSYWVRASEYLNPIYNWRIGKRLIHWNHSSFLFRKEIIDEVGYWDNVRVGADSEFIWRIQSRFGKDSVEKIYNNLPLSFALDEENTLTRNKATHIQSMYYGIRYIYREGYRNWHISNDKLRLDLNSDRVFEAPCGILNKKLFEQTLDKLYIADFNDNLTVTKIKHSISNSSKSGEIIGLLYWPDFGKERTLSKEYFKLLNLPNVKPIVAGYNVKVDEVILIDKNHSLYIPDHLPEIVASKIVYLQFFHLKNRKKTEIINLVKSLFNEKEKSLQIYKVEQLKANKNLDEIFLDEIVEFNCSEHNNKIEFFYQLMNNCKLSSINFFDHNALSYIFNNSNIKDINYSVANLIYCIDSIVQKDHKNAKIAHKILLHLNENDSFLLFKYLIDIPNEDISFINKLYILLLLKKKPEENFMQYVTLEISKFNKENFSELLDMHSLFDLVNRGAFQSNNFYLTIENTKILHNYVERILQVIVKSNNLGKNQKDKQEGIKRVVFVLSNLINSNFEINSHYIALSNFIELLNHNYKNKIEKFVIITNEKSFNLPLGDWKINEKKLLEENIKNFVQDSNIEKKENFIIHNEENKYKNLQLNFQKISEVNPYVVVFLGGTYDSKIFRYMVYQKYRTVFLPTTSSMDNAYGRPDFYFDKIKAINKKHLEDLNNFGISLDRIKYFPRSFNEKDFIINRKYIEFEELQFDKNKFYCLTPLTGGRIGKWFNSLSPNQLDKFFNIFSTDSNLSFIFIGQAISFFENLSKKELRFKKLIDEKRIHIIEFTENLKYIISNVNLLYIPSAGAATTIAIALYHAVPTILPKESDAIEFAFNELAFESIDHSLALLKEVCLNGFQFNKEDSVPYNNLKKRFDLDYLSKEQATLIFD